MMERRDNCYEILAHMNDPRDHLNYDYFDIMHYILWYNRSFGPIFYENLFVYIIYTCLYPFFRIR